MARMHSKVIVIGLDGATFTLLKPWMEQGKLPYLKSLVNHGVSGPLRSSIPPVTVPAWQCFMTGKNPGKHGIINFLQRRPGASEETLVTSVDSKTLWEILSEEGKQVAVLNFPFASPPPGFNGVMIGGFNTPPSQMKDFIYPHELRKEIEEKFGEYRITLKGPLVVPAIRADYFESRVQEFLEDCHELTDYQFQVAQYLLGRYEFDMVVFYQFIPDRIQHWLWHILDPAHHWYERETAEKFYDRIVAYYQRLDAHLASLVEKLAPDPTVIVVSDHGFGPVYKGIDLGSWLLKEGYITIKKHPTSQLKYFLWKIRWEPNALFQGFLKRLLKRKAIQQFLLRYYYRQSKTAKRARLERRLRLVRVLQRLFLSLNDVDWARTKAYPLTGFGMIRINLEGREPQGAVKQEDYETIRDEIVSKLKGLVDPDTGLKIPGQVYTKEEIYSGKYINQMPDICYLALEGGYVAGSFPIFIANRIIASGGGGGLAASHRMDGILIARGKGVKRGVTIEGANIMDIAPTVLYLMGSKIPDDMDGRVLTELFEETVLKEHPIVYTEAVPQVERLPVEVSPEDQEAVLERLKGLGYID